MIFADGVVMAKRNLARHRQSARTAMSIAISASGVTPLTAARHRGAVALAWIGLVKRPKMGLPGQ
jgi:hypothetical protein